MSKEDLIWIEHDNGPMPVAKDQSVYIKHEAGIILGPAEAGHWAWEAVDAPKGSMFYALVQS